MMIVVSQKERQCNDLNEMFPSIYVDFNSNLHDYTQQKTKCVWERIGKKGERRTSLSRTIQYNWCM